MREIYPGAWAGEAPGKKLRARAADAAAAQARHAAGPQKSAAPAAAPPGSSGTRRETAKLAARDAGENSHIGSNASSAGTNARG